MQPPCIFCGKPADSKEDLFPRWILRRVVTRQPLSRQIGDGPPEITEDQEVRLPCVCQKCNNTWLSGMETTVKKFLGPMIDGVIDSLLAAHHVLEMFRRALPNGTSRRLLDRLSNRLTKIVTEARKLVTP